ncbi:uncharacterized protein N0V89_009380 [Didymosphaeria variabile]|uniref:Fucose-specific lectin n=1 Tax=Didymosphaeria variabile TaxID=1932322 RepID=A0A9W8XFF5_9PLEO|nr:uncharacterized protein N0V89_009380 [Didymosphaeria variabile]KAJ4348008.1 hypothetical protein N0V89_009380 [Didymosphaeria variabile]
MPETASERRSSFSNLEVHTNVSETWMYKVPEYSSAPIALDPHALPEAVPDQALIRPSSGNPAVKPAAVGNGKEIYYLRRRRRLIIFSVLIGLVVIIGAVTGGILGSRHSKQAEETQKPTDDPDHQPSENSSQVLSTSKLSAVNWTSGDDTGVHYRAVFWQAVTHDLMASIWESESNEWTLVNLTLGGTIDADNAYDKQFNPAKPGTPLAATVRLHPWPKFNTIALFYLSEQNTVEQMNTNVITAKTGWNACCLSNMGVKHPAANDSQLAAFSMSCKGSQCEHDWIHITFQMAGGELALISQQDWGKRQDATGTDPQMGTGLTMTSTGSQSSSDNITFIPKLYLQTPTELQEKLWYDAGPSKYNLSVFRRALADLDIGTRVEASRTASDGSPLQLSSAIIPASGASASTSNDLLLLSTAGDGSQLLMNQYSNQTGNWTGSSTPEFAKAPSTFNFTAGALVAAPDEARFIGLESNGTIQSFKISKNAATQWEYDGVVLPN